MSSQLASIIPTGALTDDVFAFNQQQFLDIRNTQQNDLQFLSLPPVRAITAASDVVGSTATSVIGEVGQGLQGLGAAVAGGVAGITSGVISRGEQLGSGVIKWTAQVADQLVDPNRVVREHIDYSNNVKDNLLDATTKVDTTIHDLSVAIGGVQLIIQLQVKFTEVNGALAILIDVLTRDNIEENLKVGHDKYKAIEQLSETPNYLGQISDLLPKVVQTIKDVKAGFATINANLDQAKDKINSGVTDPAQIFAQSQEEVADAWKAYEVKRKSMTYLPYNH